MKNYFQCKIKHLAQLEDGSIKKVSKVYLLNALSFIEAETELQRILESSITEYDLASCTKPNIQDVIIDETGDFFFKAKVSYIMFDEDSGKEKRSNETILVQSSNIYKTVEKIKNRMEGTISDWELIGVTKTNIDEVFSLVEA